MLGISNIVQCGLCDKTIDYSNTRFNLSRRCLVCNNCQTTPQVHGIPANIKYYTDLFTEFEPAIFNSARRESPIASDRVFDNLNKSESGSLTQTILQSDCTAIKEKSAPFSKLTSKQNNDSSDTLRLHESTSAWFEFSAAQSNSGTLETFPLGESLEKFCYEDFNPTSALVNLTNTTVLDELLECEADNWGLTSFATSSEADQHIQTSTASLTSLSSSNSINPVNRDSQSIVQSQVAPPVKIRILEKAATNKYSKVRVFRSGGSNQFTQQSSKDKFDCRDTLINSSSCNASFSSMAELWQHIENTVHMPGKVLYSCKTCHNFFSSLDHLKQHQSVHTMNRPFKCQEPGCSSRFTRIGSLRQHIREIHKNEKTFQCGEPDCGQNFARKSDLILHINHHNKAKQHQCTICLKYFTRSDLVGQHMLIHTVKKSFVCEYCGKSFYQKSNLYSHSRLHTNERKYECDICDKKFKFSSNLKAHRNIHSGKTYQCKFCDKVFSQYATLYNHYKIHAEDKYACTVCDKKFARKDHLKKHQNIHSNQKNIIAVCTPKKIAGSLSYNSSLRHLFARKAFQCIFCDHTFTRGSDLDRHIKISCSKIFHG